MDNFIKRNACTRKPNRTRVETPSVFEFHNRFTPSLPLLMWRLEDGEVPRLRETVEKERAQGQILLRKRQVFGHIRTSPRQAGNRGGHPQG
jgi:hypothetical protein